MVRSQAGRLKGLQRDQRAMGQRGCCALFSLFCFEDFQDGLQLFLNRGERLGLVHPISLPKQRQIRAAILEELLIGSGDGIAILIKKLFDGLDHLQILLPVNPLSSPILGGRKNLEF